MAKDKDEEQLEEIVAEQVNEDKDEMSQEEKLSSQIDELSAKIKELEALVENLKDEKIRSLAEMENYKKRLLKDKESAIRYANESLVKDLLDPIDNFSRALESANQNQDFASLKEGLSMVESQMMSTLRTNWGLEEIDAEGKDFDPECMEAYAAEETEGVDKEKVALVFQKGYRLNGKVIRSAKVKVAKPLS
ncbi:MAG TPA: nucleotide exchange factor GrpE [Candidatus Ornithospirochaeta avicola]|uniref:Protein GrpE n=1 Tax=Candidatus Ornithospirochaeta avicola TaxID=2840896 RepID=A0A9D1PT85_9SPIO|nr:nucleotide exchange factor GrpE [Candidatus Ornithospirochaeta avicola]